ncbi:dual specificity protein phosphatase 12 isoform X3 [Heliangelus exortis]|uniref:dual specificity protein phosphatase 12 isoform X3 n=1 Tax=Heliangelus exortis TaxID=472823 RepID=UPI003A8CFCC7
MSAASGCRGGGMVRVLPGLYVGGAESCSTPESLAAEGVVAVLTVDAEEPPAVPGVRAMHVRARDEPGADLLSHLDDCATFIGAAQEGGGAVLVRCQAGVSRSVAVVTAYLMKTKGLGWEDAYAAVRASKPDAEMNPGFLGQLKLYEAMGCAVDSTSALYKRYRLQVLTEKYPAYLMEPVSGQVTAKKVTSACHGGGRGAALPCPTEMQCGCIDLIHNLVLTPLQNFKTCPEKSLLLIQPVYVKLQTQRFSTGAGNAGQASFVP